MKPEATKHYLRIKAGENQVSQEVIVFHDLMEKLDLILAEIDQLKKVNGIVVRDRLNRELNNA